MSKKCDAVFEGGGVKAIALLGAASVLEELGYEFENLAGTSAGAIVAALLAVGYNSYEIRDVLVKTNFSKFKDETFLTRLGVLGKTLKILLKYGVYSSDYFELWLNELLEKKKKLLFGDLIINKSEQYKYKFQAIASDLSEHKMLVLPGDLKTMNTPIDSFPIAKAVRMSMSIPIYYEPYCFKDHLIVDGGLLSNYPLWLFDDPDNKPEWPTFGMKLSDDGSGEAKQDKIHNLIDYTKALVTTALDAHDNYYVSTKTGDKQRTIFISTTININGRTKTIKTTDFELTQEESLALFDNGVQAAREFFAKWSFEKWKGDFK